MLGLGVEEERAHVYPEGLRRGGILVMVEVDETEAANVRVILGEAYALDIKELRQTWEEEGWTEAESIARSAHGKEATGETRVILRN